ncbi:hypothetical protein RQP46_007121 [Phenoliferia psychrophenolica]
MSRQPSSTFDDKERWSDEESAVAPPPDASSNALRARLAKPKLRLRPSGTIGTGIPELELSRQNHRTLERTNSVSFLSRPAQVAPSARLPVDFRTLSIQVTETQRGEPRALKGKKNIAELSSLEWHTLPSEEVCLRLGVAPEIGHDGALAARRLAKNGPNAISPPPRNLAKKIFFYVFGGFGSLLIGASLICFISWRPLGDPHPAASNLALAVVLLVVVAIQAVFNAWQDFSTGRVLASISGLLPSDVLVKREGSIIKVPAADLVAGDIISIVLGCKVPADVRILECSSDLQFDRSILTGESAAISGTVNDTNENFVRLSIQQTDDHHADEHFTQLEAKNIALQGTLCTSGSGTGVCVELGDSTVFGRIAQAATRERPQKTTLEVEILRFVIIIASLAFAVAVLIVVLWAAWLRRDHPGFISVPALLIDCVSVAFIPEGLPVSVTLSLTVIAAKMQRKNILCKSLSTVESLGCVSVICSDKTGTLTQNRMTVVNVAIGAASFTTTEVSDMLDDKGAGTVFSALASVAALCNDASFAGAGDEKHGPERAVNGDATDTGLLRFADRYEAIEALRHCWREVGKISFNSKNKFAIKLLQLANRGPIDVPQPISDADRFVAEEDKLLLVKGAPDILMARCSFYVTLDGTTALLDDAARAAITATQTTFASQGQRVLLLAKKIIRVIDLSEQALHDKPEDAIMALNTDLTIVGLCALVDPPREDTKETVRICRRAGIRFMMVTGDFALTAEEIAKQCGIITTPISSIKHLSDLPRDTPLDEISAFDPDLAETNGPTSLVLSGPEIMAMTESQWKHTLTFDEVVFARTSPNQKLQIVRAFQDAGCTVAVTGDGVNDAPALKQADIGVAVAGGSEVAMEAADLILLDQFSAIVVGIESGRLCFENLRKTLLYLLPAGSFSELMPVLMNVIFGLPQALSNLQMVLICVGTDVLPAMSLVFEHPEADLLLRRPRNPKTEHLVDLRVILQAYTIGVIESLCAFVGAFYFGFARSGIPFSKLWLQYGGYDVDPDLLASATNRSQTIYFFSLIVMQFFNLLSTRTRRLSIITQNPFSRNTGNFYLFPAMAISLCVGIFFAYIPAIQRVFLTAQIPAYMFFVPLGYGVGLLLLDESRKFWVRTHPKSFLAWIAW